MFPCEHFVSSKMKWFFIQFLDLSLNIQFFFFFWVWQLSVKFLFILNEQILMRKKNWYTKWQKSMFGRDTRCTIRFDGWAKIRVCEKILTKIVRIKWTECRTTKDKKSKKKSAKNTHAYILAHILWICRTKSWLISISQRTNRWTTIARWNCGFYSKFRANQVLL